MRALISFLSAGISLIAAATALEAQRPNGPVSPLCSGDICNPPPDTPPIVTIVTPGATVYTRTPLTRVVYQPGGTGPNDPIGSVTITWGGTDVTSLGRRNDRLFEWEVTSAYQLSPGASKALVATVCNLAGHCTTQSVTVTLSGSPSPILSVTTMPLEALGRRNMVPLGGGFAVDGTELVTSVATPAWFSWNTPHTTGLTYSSRQSYPRALVHADLEFPGSLPSSLTLKLWDGATLMSQWTQSSPSCSSGGQPRCRVALRADYLGGTGSQIVRKWLRIEALATIGGTVYSSVDSAEVVIVDRRTTPYGSGWWPTGVMRVVASGSDAILVGSDGSATIYRGSNGRYISPPGDPNTLTGGSGWTLTLRAGGTISFDTQGRMIRVQGQNPQWRTDYSYDGTSDRLTQILEVTVNKSFTFAYTGGLISTVTDPGGRIASVAISSNQLTGFAPPSPSGQNQTVTFAWTGYSGSAVLPAYVQNALGQRTSFGYSGGDWPITATLPWVQNEYGGSVQPVVRYDAPELRGLGATASLDTVYARVTDPRGNWTAATLNRWGEPLRTWDAVGTLGVSTYSVEGYLLSTEGRSGDSSRVYRTYDSMGRLVRTYRLRSGGSMLRLDSLVYGLLDRVVQRIDAFTNTWSYGYNAWGSLTQSLSPFGNSTYNYYNATTGRMDSTRVSGVAGVRSYQYDAVWGNTARITNGDGAIYTNNYYDGYGRLDSAVSKLVVRATSGTTQMQWRRRIPFYNVANQLDSVRIERTVNCDTPCNTPPGIAETSTTRRRYSYIGLDSLRLGPSNLVQEEVTFDALGRVVRRARPTYTGAMASDTFKYDVAGNLRFQVTRRGYVLETQYESRNRASRRIIPVVGTFDLAYAGPNDELTAITAQPGYQDPVGGSNVNVAWSYDVAGRLRSDTVQGNRSTTYAYDTYERLTSVTDAVGSWQTRFHATRGTPDTLVTPFGDSLGYSYDAVGRYNGPTVGNPGNWRFARTQVWRSWGGLLQLHNDVAGAAPFAAGYHILADEEPSAAHDSLSPRWEEVFGYPGPGHTGTDSLQYDGWERVVHVDYLRDAAVLSSQNFSLDAANNLSINGSWSFSAGGNQLLSTAGCWNLVYDAEGDLTAQTCGGATTYFAYDPLGRLTEVSGAVSAQYTYDALGQRIAKKVAGVVTRFVWRGGHVIYETDGSGTIQRSYTWGSSTDDLVAIHNHQDGQHYYVVQDLLRSVRGLVRRDGGQGTWVAAWRYRLYGEVLTSDGSLSFPLRFRWAGAQYDDETGLYYLRSRYYSPVFGRFIQEDPIGFAGGANLYAYAAGDPSGQRDPDGLVVGMEPQYHPDPSLFPTEDPFEGSHGGGGSSGWMDELDAFWAGVYQETAEIIARQIAAGRCAGANATTQAVCSITATVYGEASFNAAEQLAVAYVIMDRARDTGPLVYGNHRNTGELPVDVIYQATSWDFESIWTTRSTKYVDAIGQLYNGRALTGNAYNELSSAGRMSAYAYFGVRPDPTGGARWNYGGLPPQTWVNRRCGGMLPPPIGRSYFC